MFLFIFKNCLIQIFNRILILLRFSFKNIVKDHYVIEPLNMEIKYFICSMKAFFLRLFFIFIKTIKCLFIKNNIL